MDATPLRQFLQKLASYILKYIWNALICIFKIKRIRHHKTKSKSSGKLYTLFRQPGPSACNKGIDLTEERSPVKL